MSAVTTEPEDMDFGRLRIAFDDRVLRPRAVDRRPVASGPPRSSRTRPRGPVLELCSGAGQIGLLAVADTDRQLVCVDLDPVACDYARRNADAAGMADRVEVREGAIDEMVRDDERFAVVVADPPWVRRTETGRYPEDPLLAIDGGDDGMDVAWPCIDTARLHLRRAARCCSRSGRSSRSTPSASGCAATSSASPRCAWHERGVLVRIDRSCQARQAGRSLLGQHLVGAVAPGERRRLVAAADRRDRPGRLVRDAVGVLDDVVAAQQHRAAGADDRLGVLEGASCDVPLVVAQRAEHLARRSGPRGRGR